MSLRRVSAAFVVGVLVIAAAAFNARAQDDFCGNNLQGLVRAVRRHGQRRLRGGLHAELLLCALV